MTRLRNDQLTGAVGDFVRAIALGSLDMADAQRRACDLLGIPQPNPAGTAHALIAHMEKPEAARNPIGENDIDAALKGKVTNGK